MRATGALAGHGEVAFATTTTGVPDMVPILELADAAHLDRYLTEQVGALPGALNGVPYVEIDLVARWIKCAGAAHPRSMTSMRACLRACSNP